MFAFHRSCRICGVRRPCSINAVRWLLLQRFRKSAPQRSHPCAPHQSTFVYSALRTRVTLRPRPQRNPHAPRIVERNTTGCRPEGCCVSILCEPPTRRNSPPHSCGRDTHRPGRSSSVNRRLQEAARSEGLRPRPQTLEHEACDVLTSPPFALAPGSLTVGPAPGDFALGISADRDARRRPIRQSATRRIPASTRRPNQSYG
jgi:hypothetical protein